MLNGFPSRSQCTLPQTKEFAFHAHKHIFLSFDVIVVVIPIILTTEKSSV
jgi:hypothetical protein